MTARLTLAALCALSVAGCSNDSASPIDGAPPAVTAEGQAAAGAYLVARDTERDYAASLADDRLTDACAEAGIVALSYREASLPDEATRWQATTDSTCAALDARADSVGTAVGDAIDDAMVGLDDDAGE